MYSKFPRRLLRWFSWLGVILVSLLIIALGEIIPIMSAFQHYQETHLFHNQILISVTAAMIILGTLLLAFTQFLVRVPDPRQAPPVKPIKTRDIWISPGKIFSGMMISVGFSDQARMWRVKKAFREGEWWIAPRWRRMTLMMLGAILLFYGLFGLFFLLSPPGIKFFLFLVVVYATVRSIYAFAVDHPNRK